MTDELLQIEAPARRRLDEVMRETLEDERRYHNWTYWFSRPIYMPPKPWRPARPTKSDCSKGVQIMCWLADAPDPMGNHFGPFGNSATICAHLQHLDHPSELQVGDPVTFGFGGNEHAAITLEPGPDPLLWSDGHQGAPNTYRLSWDRRVHQLLRLPVVYIATPDDRLRAKTGYWAWVQWKLGEGDWRHHLAGDPKVRPNVPTRIAAAWIAQYIKFVAARKHGNKPTTHLRGVIAS